MAPAKKRTSRATLSAKEREKLGAEFMRRWGWMLRPAMRLEKNIAAAAKSPSSTKDRLESEIGRRMRERIARMGEEAFISDWIGDWMPVEAWRFMRARFPAWMANERKKLSRDSFKERPCLLIEAAHAAVPYSPFLAVRQPGDAFEPMLEGVRRELALRDAAGREHRIRLVADAVAAFGEATYRTYLEQVRTLAGLCDGTLWRPKRRAKFGDLVRDLRDRQAGSLAPLVEPLSARVRNAVLHDGPPRYESRARVLVLTDRDAGWSERMSYATLAGMFRRMHRHVSGFNAALSLFQFKAQTDAGVTDLICRLMIARRTNDQPEIDLVGQEYQRWERGMLDTWAGMLAPK